MPVQAVSQDRWLVSYADLLTLLFALFVVMYSISQARDGDVKVLSDSISAAFFPAQKQAAEDASQKSSPSSFSSAAPVSAVVPLRPNLSLETQGIARVADLVAQTSHKQGLDNALFMVRSSGKGIEIEINATLLYPSASAVLLSSALPILKDLSILLAPLPYPVRVEGFTDDRPIMTERYASNWELSAARAASVVSLFANEGVEPSRLSILAHAAQNPVASNATEQGRSRNRRVLISVLYNEGSQEPEPLTDPWSELVKMATLKN